LPGVFVALNVPQLPTGAHDHVTPALRLSLETTADRLVGGAPGDSCEGAEKLTAISGTMVIVAVPDAVVLVAEYAVSITGHPGLAAGA
jgi:hypothetical protein